MRGVLMTVQIFEMVVVGLHIAGMSFIAGVPVVGAGAWGGAAAALPVVAAALLRSGVGYVLGWIAQLAGLALGLLTALMFIVGALFAAVWVLAFVLGKRLDSRMETSPEGGDIP